MKLIWRVSPVPTGRYRSFEHRSWPSANYKNGRPAVSLSCAEDYCGRLARATDGLEIKIDVADWSIPGNSFKWRTMKQRAVSLAQAKQLATDFLTKFHPEFAEKKVSP